jgi:hypothetical protein
MRSFAFRLHNSAFIPPRALSYRELERGVAAELCIPWPLADAHAANKRFKNTLVRNRFDGHTIGRSP